MVDNGKLNKVMTQSRNKQGHMRKTSSITKQPSSQAFNQNGWSPSRTMLHHQARANADTSMIGKFNTVDDRFEYAASNEAISVRSNMTANRGINYPAAVSPGRFSYSRLKEDQVSARTINPDHNYYQTFEYEASRQKTFGSLKAAPKYQDNVTTPDRVDPKVVQGSKPRNVTTVITNCPRKHNPMNYKSNYSIGYDKIG